MGAENNKNNKSENTKRNKIIIHEDEKPNKVIDINGNQQEANKDNNTMISAGSIKGGPTTQPTPQLEDDFDYGVYSFIESESGIIETESDEEDGEEGLIAGKYEQRRIKRVADAFRHECYYGPYADKKFCIWSGGDTFSWPEKTSGISWIGINGTDAACVVALKERPLPPSGRTHQLASSQLLYTALCDMGVLADTSTASTEFRRTMIAQSSSKKVGPFAVVSVAPGPAAEDHLGSSHGALPAIEFLVKKLEGRSAIAHCEIRQIAVCALKFLLGPKFDPNMIEVMSSGKQDYSKFGASEIQELLSAMNQCECI